MRIARSVCVDASRMRQLETVALDFDVADETTVTDDDNLALEAALERLPDELREAVELRFGTGLGLNDVAYALGISRFAARRRINAALKLLEEELGEGGLDG